MDDQSRAKTLPLDVRRAFVTSRLESQVLIRAYELAVPVVRRRAIAGHIADGCSRGEALGTKRLAAQGA